jgi:fructoselysine 6-phosphate deglycase
VFLISSTPTDLSNSSCHQSILQSVLPSPQEFRFTIGTMKDLLTKPDLTVADMEAALEATVAQLPQVAQFGREISRDITHIDMVSCGGGQHMFDLLQWWCDVDGKKGIAYRTFSSAKYLSLGRSDKVDKNTLVILSSKSGSTKETLAVGNALKGKGAKVVVFTLSEQSKLAQYGKKSIYTGDTPQSFQAMLMLKYAFLGGIWAEREGWTELGQLLASLAALPAAMANAALARQESAKEIADDFDTTGTIHFIAMGPMEFTSKAFGWCLLEEMLEIDINAYGADHFNHSLVEKFPLKPADRVFLLVGPDTCAWQIEQVRKLLTEHAKQTVFLCDARKYQAEMEDIDPSVQAMLAPLVVEAALKPLVEPLAAKTKDPDTRKYMGNVDLWAGTRLETV